MDFDETPINLKHFSIAFKNNNDNSREICEYAEKSDEAIKNGINEIPILKNNNSYRFRFFNESHLEWLCSIESLNKKEWYRDSLTKVGKFILKEIKDYITQIFQWLKTSFKSALEH